LYISISFGATPASPAAEPYEKLKRALRADIDEAAWSTFYSTASHPFARPGSGKIAVKVIA
jgi:adenine-specific DNA-methyltransferase